MDSQPRLRPSSRRKREALLDAAEQVFLDRGYQDAGMDEITRRAGVAKQTAYAHFASKEGLFTEVVERANGSALVAGHHEEPDPRDEAELGTWLRDFARRQLDAVLEPRVLAMRRLVIAEAERHPELAAAFWRAGPEAAIDRLADRLARLTGAGLIAVVDTRRAAEHLNWLVMGEAITAAMMLGTAGIPADAERGRIAEAAARAFLHGYAG